MKRTHIKRQKRTAKVSECERRVRFDKIAYYLSSFTVSKINKNESVNNVFSCDLQRFTRVKEPLDFVVVKKEDRRGVKVAPKWNGKGWS